MNNTFDLAGLREQAETFFASAQGSHDWDHTLRVARLCRLIGPLEQADMDVLLAAAYLHDIGRGVQDKSSGSICHAQRGAELARPLVDRLPFTNERRKNIIHCIRAHRFRDSHAPATMEARVLFDADKLDAIGAVGIARAYLFAGEIGARLHNPDHCIDGTQSYSTDDTGFREYKVKLSLIRERMMTATGKKLADERHAFMEDFFRRFVEEYDGLR